MWDFILLILGVGVTSEHDWERRPWTLPPSLHSHVTPGPSVSLSFPLGSQL